MEGIGTLGDTLTVLNLANNKAIEDDGLRLMLQGFTNLEDLKMMELNRVTGAAFSGSGCRQRLRSLHLWGCYGLQDAGLEAISHLEALTSLNLTYCDGISEAGFASLARLKALQSLDVVCEHFEDSWLKALVELDALTSLSVTECNLTDVGMMEIAKLRRLTTLNVQSSRQLADDGIVSLVDSPTAQHSLTNLDISQCPNLSDASLKAIGSNMKALRTLAMRSNPTFTNLGMQHLSSTKASSKALMSLDISRCGGVNDRGLAHLRKLGQLTYLCVADCDR